MESGLTTHQLSEELDQQRGGTSMALTPEQKQAAHERGLRLKAERESREAQEKPAAARISSDYDRFRSVGLSHEEALQEIEKRRLAEERSLPPSGGIGDLVYTGPRGGRYRINGRGRKSYDVR